MSKEERIEGIKLIEAEIRKSFSAEGKDVTDIEWTSVKGGDPLNADNVNINIKSNGKSYDISNLSREALEDYPGGVGNEKLNSIIRNLARQ